MNDDTETRLDRLTKELETLNKHRFIRMHNSLWRLILFNFTRGLAFGLGSVRGASILVSLLVWWLSQCEFIPIIGDFTKQLIDWIDVPAQASRLR